MTDHLVEMGGAVARRPISIQAVFAVVLLVGGPLGGGQSVSADVIESFEGPNPSWSLAESDCQASIAVQQRRLAGAHSGQGCEFLRVAMAQGTRVFLAHKIPPSSMIAEWQPSVWVKSDRPGIQLLVRVVLPRTIDQRSGKPMTTLLSGTTYQDVGAWQQLTLTEPLVLLDRQVRVLRTQWSQPIDPRQAYVDLIVLNAHGGASATNLWIDDLELRGLVQARGATDVDPWSTSGGIAALVSSLPEVRAAASSSSQAAPASQDFVQAAAWSPDVGLRDESPGQPARPAIDIGVQGSLLMVGRRPLMPRVARWRGEPFDWLKELGFNTLLLSQPPTRQQQLEAGRRDLWLIAPPPASFDADDSSGSRAFDRVIAWSMGTQLGQSERDATWERAQAVRRSDPLAHRPILCGGDVELDAYSRVGDILVSNAWSRVGRLTLADNASGLSPEARSSIRRGVPLWADVLLPAPSIRNDGDEQRAFAAAGIGRPSYQRVARERRAAVSSVSGQELIDVRWAVYQALSDGTRGVILSPADSLEPGRDELKPLLDTVRTLNEELTLIEPWVLSGAGVEDARVSDDRYRVRMLEHPRARLAIVMREPSVTDNLSGDFGARSRARLNLPDAGMSFVDTGTHGAAEAYEITPTGLKRLRRSRVTGGVEVVLDQRPALALVVLTNEPLVVSYLSRGLARR